MIDLDQQVAYWESRHKRRYPSDPIIAAFARPKLEFVLNYLDLPPSPQILDVGCGNGYFTYYLQELGWTTGIDYAAMMLKSNPCSNLALASALELPFQSSSFDLSFCSNLLHHMTDPLQAVIEMKRVSRQYLVISEPNRNNPAILALGLLKPEERGTLHFTSSFLRSLAEQAGLHVLTCETMGFVTPNRMPRLVVKGLSNFNKPNPFAAYIVLVAQCYE